VSSLMLISALVVLALTTAAPPDSNADLRAKLAQWPIPQTLRDVENHYEVRKMLAMQLVAADRCDDAEASVVAYGYLQLGETIRAYCFATGRSVRDGPDLKRPVDPTAWGQDISLETVYAKGRPPSQPKAAAKRGR
ncbi:MAG: hypothetical protein KAG62_11790, partial [Caulobacter sp.]|nr:hypothetical protein [Caulobacter sp.]